MISKAIRSMESARVIPRSGSRTVGYIKKQFRPDPVNSGLMPTVVSRRGFARYGVGRKQLLWKQARSAELPVGTVSVPGGEEMLINGQQRLIALNADRDSGVSLRLFDDDWVRVSLTKPWLMPWQERKDVD